MNTVTIGGVTYTAAQERNGHLISSHSVIGETLAADTFRVTILSNDPITDYPTGTSVLYSTDDGVVNQFYVNSVVQVGAKLYQLECVSTIGLLVNSQHLGGIYTGETAGTVIDDILGSIPHTIDPTISAIQIKGYLPIASRRDNFQAVLCVTGASVRVDQDGKMNIGIMSAVSTGTFPASRVYAGGTVEVSDKVTAVQLTEHHYSPTAEIATLFDAVIDGSQLIVFGEPMKNLSITGGTIVSSGANYAVISGSGAVVLTGEKYNHSTRVITIGTILGDGTDNVKSISNLTLANPEIAEDLAQRFYDYLICDTKIKQGVLFGTERAGDVVSVINPFSAVMEDAVVTAMDVTLSGVNRANAEFLVGYEPQGAVVGFENYTILTGSGNWTVPAGVSKIRFIAIGGGSGGGAGDNGADGGDGSVSGSIYNPNSVSAGNGGNGGKAGRTGVGGKVFELSLAVNGGDVIAYSCGAGGTGGTALVDPTDGTDTTFGLYSSSYGKSYPYGYAESKSGLTLAANGADGFDGGDGGAGNISERLYQQTSADWGDDGQSVNGNAGGAASHVSERTVSSSHTITYTSAGGGGATNAAIGADGYRAEGGAGGNATAGADATNYGEGGGGGSGGGGGGGGGLYVHWDRNATPSQTWSYYAAVGGAGGSGADGGDGHAGCVVVYY